MSKDYRQEIYSRACEIAAIEHDGQDYESLPDNIQAEVYQEAISIYGEPLQETAERIHRINESRRPQ